MKNKNITTKQAEIVGAIICALPPNSDEVSNLQIKELFNNEDIYDYDGTKWNFSATNFLASVKNDEEALSFLDFIEKITAKKVIDDKCIGYYSGCGCVVCDIRDRRGDKRRRVR